nr:uncharacterized protein CI109_001817 [Kwoniella shandongensis]KAA5529877.1 hypothetical protein CI109_001817 [Kwoniella shandongensis]
MKENKTVENVTATIGAVLWAVQGVPQIWKSYRTKSTKGLSPHLMIPQYYEIFKLGQVRGVSWGFVAIDIIGAIFGMISLFFRAKFDIAAFVVYALTAAMMTLIVVLALILNPRATKRRRLDQSSTIVIPSAVNTTVTPSTFVDVPLHEKNENDSHEPGYPEPVTRPNGAMNPELGNQAESPMTQVHEADSLHHLAYISPAKP